MDAATVTELNTMCPVAGVAGLGTLLQYFNTDGTFRIGDWAASGAAGNAIPLANVVHPVDTSQANVVGVFGVSDTALGSGIHACVGRFRHLVRNASLSFDITQETYGVVGQLVAKSVELKHLHAGVLGTFEGNTTAVICNSPYSVGHAAVIARIGGHALITATTPLAGFLAFNNASAALVSGISAAFAASSFSASYPWSVGIYMPVGSVTQGIRIGNWVGSGSSGSAIPISAATDSADTSQRNLVACYGESTADLTSAIHANVGRFRHLVSCAADTVISHETYGLVGQVCVKNGSMNHYHSGLMGTFECTSTLCHVQTSYGCAGVIGRVGTSNTTIESGGLLCGVLALSNTTDTSFTHTGTYAAFAAKTAAGKHAWLSLIEVPSDLAGSSNGSGADVYLNITVNGTAARITAKYVA